MAEYVFNPPLRLAGGVVVRTLDDAAEFARKYNGAKWVVRRDGVLHSLQGASGEERERDAGNAFRAWAEAEGVLVG